MSIRKLAVLAALSMVLSVLTLPPAGAEPLNRGDLQPAEARVASENPFKGLPAGIFIVSLEDPAVALYDGGIEGLQATSTQGRSQLNVAAPAAVAYRDHLQSRQSILIARLNRDLAGNADVKAQYFNAANAMAVHLTPEEAARVLRMPGVKSVVPDVMRQIDTDRGPGWIGAPSIWDGTAANIGTQGEGIIVGVLDTGINWANPSFADIGGDGYDHTNPFGAGNYVGVCDAADPEYDPTFVCNDKLIGAWNETVDPGPLDDDGHGSHTASTAAGNHVQATVAAPTETITPMISGVAPHANIIAYDVCTTSQGCPGYAILGGIDQAIEDGVDVINYSIGSTTPNDPWSQPDGLGFLAAREAGIFVAHSAGNEGPDASTSGSPNAPWMTHVAATTHPRRYSNSIGNFTGGNSALADLSGLGFTGAYGPANIVYAGDYPSAETDTPELCGAGNQLDFNSPWDPGTFNGEIVVCDRGTFGRIEKGANVLAAGAGGFVLVDNGAGLVGDPHELPGVHITQADGGLLKAWLASGSGHRGVIGGAAEDINDANADILAGFSSRGPNSAVDMIIPSIAAPGVDIIAAAGTSNETSWGFLSGTSMASPHVAGAAALLMSLYPDWTPAEIQSAMQLTATTAVVREDAATPATPFERGSGRIDLNAAANAGLIMDESVEDYLAADPATGGDVGAINLPSMANSACVVTCSWTRTVTATANGTWTATVAGEDGLALRVSPENFTLAVGESQQITVTADVSGAASGIYVFGNLVLDTSALGAAGNAIPAASMPIAVRSTTGDIPSNLHITTRRDAGSWKIDNLTALEISDLTVEVEGLVVGEQDRPRIRQDSANRDVFDDYTDGTFLKLVDIPEGTTNFISEILVSKSPDLDLFMGFDLNNDGIPTQNELRCVSASATALESCEFAEPPAGQWWVLVQNWTASAAGAKDAFTLSTAVLDGNDRGNMSVAGPGSVGQLEPFSLRVFFDEETNPRERYYGSFSLGTDAGNAGNLGRVAVKLDRLQNDVRKAASTDLAMPGDIVTYAITIRPNVMNEDVTYDLTDTIPEGMTYVPGSATGGAAVADGVLSWSGVLPSPFLAEGSYVASTNRTDAMCDTPFGGGYVDLESLGIAADPGISGDTVGFTAFTSGDEIEFYGNSHSGMSFTDDGFAVFDFATNYGGSPWINQAIPDPALPNNLAALFWQDFEIFYDPATNQGVSLASADAPGGLVVVEYDDIELFGGSDPVMDMEVFVTRTVDDTPGAYEVTYAYTNVADSLPGTVGVEGPAGTLAATVDSSLVADGLVVCFDWTGSSFDPIVITYDVTIDESAELGVSTNRVVSATSTPGSVTTTAAVEVEVMDAPAATLAAYIDQLAAWVNNPPDDLSADDVARLLAAHDHLVKAMTPGRWVNETTLDAATGRASFGDMKRAVAALGHITKGTSLHGAKNHIKRGLVKVSELLADVAYQQAVDSGLADEVDLERALARMAKADVMQSRYRWKMAIRKSRAAWVASVQHLLG